MSVHYLIDPFTTNGDVIDVRTPENGQSDATGATVIRIPDGVGITTYPSTRDELLTAKYEAILAANPGFTNIVGDSCMDVLTFDTVSAFANQVYFSDGWVNHSLLDGGIASVVPISILPDAAPEQCILLWEEYTFVDTDDKSGRLQRVYSEESGSLLDALVTFDGSPEFFNQLPTTNGAVVNLTGFMGTDLAVSFLNTSGQRVYLGSWAVIY